MIQTDFGTFDGTSWERLCQLAFKLKYGPSYQRMPASPGDYGIEGWTTDGLAFQCYCPERHYTQDELYEAIHYCEHNLAGYCGASWWTRSPIPAYSTAYASPVLSAPSPASHGIPEASGQRCKKGHLVRDGSANQGLSKRKRKRRSANEAVATAIPPDAKRHQRLPVWGVDFLRGGMYGNLLYKR